LSALRTAADLQTVWQDRSMHFGVPHRTMDDLVGVYHGTLPSDYDDFFHPEMHVHVVNMIRLAWDDLATLAGKEFPLFVRPDNGTVAAKQRAEKLEQVGYGYNRAGRIAGSIHMKQLMKVLSWWLVGCANSVAMVLPDFKHKNPYFTFRDPRSHYPPTGWSPYTQAAPEDALFAYQLTIGELKQRYPESADSLNTYRRRVITTPAPGRNMEDNTLVWVGEYYHEDSWMVATLEDRAVLLTRSDSGDKGHPGVQPVVSLGLYSPDGAKGRSLFADQVSIQAAMARMFSQKLDYYDRSLYPLIFHTPLASKTIRVGPYATNEYAIEQNLNPRVDVIAPQNPVDADQTMTFAVGLSRMLNRNPESMQGQGPAESAKALRELKGAVNQTVQDHLWPAFLEGLPQLYSKAARMDVNLWGNVQKKSTGVRKNAAFTVNYTPGKDLKGREDDFELEAGLGLAGYQGTLEILQLLGAEAVSEDMALEQLEYVREPQEEKRRIQGDRTEKVMWADLQAKAANGMLQPGALARIRRKVQGGTDLFDAVEQEEAAGTLVVEPPAAPAGPPGSPSPAGPPGAEDIIPTLGALRGGMG
jgi:hypothetical protein